jgi:hypothetical protein
MPMYRKKPVVNEAQQWTGDNIHDLWEWITAAFLYGPTPAEPAIGPDASGKGCTAQPARLARLYVAANDAWLNLEVGEWIIKDSLGFYPCKAEVFAATYEAV